MYVKCHYEKDVDGVNFSSLLRLTTFILIDNTIIAIRVKRKTLQKQKQL